MSLPSPSHNSPSSPLLPPPPLVSQLLDSKLKTTRIEPLSTRPTKPCLAAKFAVLISQECKNSRTSIYLLCQKYLSWHFFVTDLAPLLAPEHSDLAKSLSEIPSATVAVVNLEFEGSVLPLQVAALFDALPRSKGQSNIDSSGSCPI